MSRLLVYEKPRQIALREVARPDLAPNQVRVATLYSGISAGTDLTLYRHTNPKLTRIWDQKHNVFVSLGDGPEKYSPDAAKELTAPGYEQVGRIIEVGDQVEGIEEGQVIFGAWGHRSEAVVDGAVAAKSIIEGFDPILGVFARTGIVALNGVLEGQVNVGEAVAVYGLGVIGQLVAQLSQLSGAIVVGADLIPFRCDVAAELNSQMSVADNDEKASDQIRKITDGAGADVCFEVTGSTAALHDAIRACAYSARVVSLGFYQGEAKALFLGEEFHHNRVTVAASQISGVPPHLQHRWDRARLNRVIINLLQRKKLNVAPLITHVRPFDEAAELFAMVDEQPDQVLQAVFTFPENGS